MSSARKGSAEKTTTIAHTRLEDESMIEESYTLGVKLGQGTFGKVYEAVHKESKVKWAIKSVNKEKAGGTAINLIEREVAILKRVNHEHIIRLNEVFETSKRMFLVMELCQGGELADELKIRGKFSESETKNIMKNLASAISYLHKNDIVHRDLKLENILLSQNPQDPQDKLHIKVTDFGLSVVKGGVGHENMMQAFCGTPIYMAPEILDNRSYSQQCDIWAMGVIMYLLLTGRPPFNAKDEDTLSDLIRKAELDFSGDIWIPITEDAQWCITGMLTVDPAHRFTASEVLDHSWLTGQRRDTTNVLALMKEWKDELRLESQQKEKEAADVAETSAINGDITDGVDAELNDSSTCTPGSRTGSAKGSAGSSKVSLKKGSSRTPPGSSTKPGQYSMSTQKSPRHQSNMPGSSGVTSSKADKTTDKRSPSLPNTTNKASSSSLRTGQRPAAKPAATPTPKTFTSTNKTSKKK